MDKNGAAKKGKNEEMEPLGRNPSQSKSYRDLLYPAKSPNLGKSQKQLHEKFGR